VDAACAAAAEALLAAAGRPALSAGPYAAFSQVDR